MSSLHFYSRDSMLQNIKISVPDTLSAFNREALWSLGIIPGRGTKKDNHVLISSHLGLKFWASFKSEN